MNRLEKSYGAEGAAMAGGTRQAGRRQGGAAGTVQQRGVPSAGIYHQMVPLPPPPLMPAPAVPMVPATGKTRTDNVLASSSSTWTYKTRIRPERGNRRTVQRMQWRASRWASAFGGGGEDEEEEEGPFSDPYRDVPLDARVASMTISDVSPRLALKRILLLYESHQFRAAANFVNRLSAGTFRVLLHQLPLDLFVESMPHSLSVLEALYAKVFLSADCMDVEGSGAGGLKKLRPEAVVMQMVKYFAKHHQGPATEAPAAPPTNQPFISSCKKLLKLIVVSDPKIRKALSQRRRALDKALEGLGQHGLVASPTDAETLVNLQDALKVEFTRVVSTYREALSRLEALWGSSGGGGGVGGVGGSGVGSIGGGGTGGVGGGGPGSPPVHASHQRQLSLRSPQIQRRLIKNKSLLNAVEPAMMDRSLAVLLGILQRRVDHDKQVLFQFTQLRKEAARDVPSDAVVAPILMRYSYGCQQVLQMMKEVAEDEDDDSSDISGYHSDSDSAIMMSGNSPYISKRARYNFLTRSIRSGSKASDRASLIVAGLEPPPPADGKRRSGAASRTPHHACGSGGGSSGIESGGCGESPGSTPPSTPGKGIGPSSGPLRPRQLKARKELQKLNSAGSSSSSSTTSSATIACCPNCRPLAALQLPEGQDDHKISRMHQELANLRSELIQAKGTIAELRENEVLLNERLAVEQKARVEAEEREAGGSHYEGLIGVDPEARSTDGGCSGSSAPAGAWGGGGGPSAQLLLGRYASLYAQARVDTLDALDNLAPLKEAEELKAKILFSVVVLSFRSAQSLQSSIKAQVREVLQIPASAQSTPPPTAQAVSNVSTETSGVAEVEEAVSEYLRRNADSFNMSRNVEEVCSQIWATLYDYPCLKSCDGLVQYVKSAVRLAWNLINQSPPYVLEYEHRSFRKDMHIRFHSSDQNSDRIRCYLWPALLEGGANGPCVHKAVVIT
ncbi:uncharacterized protein LOC124153215 [Ischnura elegans]|uniref:uncharacterized protein LOC124153215 n=1 Tax=Ischnura elegans TaxID=197161 RepID=UPI001ED87F99|nr:uncharacterized protein LOC124153215 [Ischnura elegans]